MQIKFYRLLALALTTIASTALSQTNVNPSNAGTFHPIPVPNPTASPDSAFSGIGVELGPEGQRVLIKRIFPDGPADAQGGLHVGDQIIAVAQDKESAVQTDGLAQTGRLIRGPTGSTVLLTIIPAGEDASHIRVVSFVRSVVKGPWGDGILLASGTKAPDIEMATLTGHSTERLSDYAGKIVVLEFWATWCGPCQTKMAELQTYPGKHPDWTTNVVLISASIDDREETAAKHLKARGWEQTHNVRVATSAIRAYHINAIPTTYVISRQGDVAAVNPQDLPQAVNHELGRSAHP